MTKNTVTMSRSGSILVLMLSVLTGCSSDSDGGVMAPTMGQLTVEIHDHPTPEIAECWITIDSVEARHLDGEWMHVAGTMQPFDLMPLQNGHTRVLGTQSVPSGRYDHLRIHLSAVRLVLADGTEVNVPLPQGGHEVGIPIPMPCDVVAGSGAHVVLDFRVPTSFRHDPDESWTCDPDVVVDDVWQHGGSGHHHHQGG